jgi:thiamine-monophosphate kinase
MMDISDGLARDVRRIGRASGVGVRIEAASLPVRAEVAGEADAGVRRALTDGEDYELLVVVAGDRAGEFPAAWAAFTSVPCTRIGVVTGAEEGFLLVDERGGVGPLPEGGYDHFGRDGAEGGGAGQATDFHTI